MGKDRVDAGRGRPKAVVKKGQSSQNRVFYLAIALVAIAGIGALTYLSTRKAQNVSLVDSTLPRVVSEGYVVGNANAPLEVIEFGDFECPGCGQWATLVEPDVRTQLVNTGRIRMRFIDYPLPMHKNTWNASRAAACAADQGKFWEMHDAIYANQDRWNGEATSRPDGILKDLAKPLGMDMKKFDDCVDSKATQAKIQAHLSLATARHIPATPTFIIGDQQHSGAIGFDQFKKAVDEAIAKGAKTPSMLGDSAGRAAAKPDSTKR
jgi:protein-disulfide isomerase